MDFTEAQSHPQATEDGVENIYIYIDILLLNGVYSKLEHIVTVYRYIYICNVYTS